VQEVTTAILSMYRKTENARGTQMQRTQFIQFCSPLLTAWRDVDERLKASTAEGEALGSNATTVADAPAAPRFVINPSSRWHRRWRYISNAVAIFFFLEVPFRIAFHSLYCFGRWYVLLPVNNDCRIKSRVEIFIVCSFKNTKMCTHVVYIRCVSAFKNQRVTLKLY
jgi:hypothetical protein